MCKTTDLIDSLRKKLCQFVKVEKTDDIRLFYLKRVSYNEVIPSIGWINIEIQRGDNPII